MMTTINFRDLTEDTTFTATRTIQNSTHDLGAIERGKQVMFRANRDGSFTLSYLTGEPTNGNQYREFSDWQSVRAFVESFGLVASDA